MEECLQLLIKDLRHLQHGLDAELRTDKFIHNKLINACQDIPACQYACFKPADGLAGLINDLRSSIITFQKVNPDNTQTQAFFTDWRYHKQYQTPSAPAPEHASPIFPSTTPFIPASSQAPGTGPALAAQPTINTLSTINPPATITTIRTGHGRELPKLAKTYTDAAKHSGQNDSSMSSLLENFRMGSTGGRGSCQAMRWMRWDTQDGMDETRAGVG